MKENFTLHINIEYYISLVIPSNATGNKRDQQPRFASHQKYTQNPHLAKKIATSLKSPLIK